MKVLMLTAWQLLASVKRIEKMLGIPKLTGSGTGVMISLIRLLKFSDSGKECQNG
jgi:hypothetical protein